MPVFDLTCLVKFNGNADQLFWHRHDLESVARLGQLSQASHHQELVARLDGVVYMQNCISTEGVPGGV